MQHSPPEYYQCVIAKFRKIKILKKNTTFGVSNSQGIQNTKASTLRCSTKTAA